ncbi:MAG: hypothetical protein GY795_39250 [Desulfobacterales bacterium]|nr:hypothetical protein [Desulfobacterales bacterium]
MKNKTRYINSIFLPLIIIIMITTPVSAIDFCNPDYLTGCKDLATDECLQKFLACGKYKEIINHFSAERFKIDNKAKYYLGAAFYGLYIRNRAYSLKCEYAGAAKSHLRSFLADKTSLFNDQGNFGGADLHEQIYHATKLYDQLQTVEGCLETGLSEQDINSISETYLHKTLKSLFIGNPPSGGLGNKVKAKRDAIRSAIQGFISKAANIETQIGMRKLELEASRRRIDAIIEFYGKIDEKGNHAFGTAKRKPAQGKIQSVKLQLDKTGRFKEAENRVNEYDPFVKKKEKEFYEAMGHMNIEDYEKAQKKIVRKAKNTLFHSELLQKNIKPLVENETYKIIKEKASGKEALSGERLEKIKNKWKDYGEKTGYCPGAWYCR